MITKTIYECENCGQEFNDKVFHTYSCGGVIYSCDKNKWVVKVWVGLDELKKEIEHMQKSMFQTTNGVRVWENGYNACLKDILFLCNSQEQKEEVWK